MIKGNTIYFGYGDIAVGCTWDGCLTLQWFKPPQEVGDYLTDKEVEWLSNEIKLQVGYKNLNDISKIDGKENKQIVIGDYTLDFSNYNKLSVEVVKEKIDNALTNILRVMAC